MDPHGYHDNRNVATAGPSQYTIRREWHSVFLLNDRSWNLNNPRCPACDHALPWRSTLKNILGPGRQNRATWGVVCPECSTDLKVPNARVLLIAAAGIFFGSQTSTLLVLRDMSNTEFWLAKLWLIVGFYAIAIFFLLKLEPLE